MAIKDELLERAKKSRAIAWAITAVAVIVAGGLFVGGKPQEAVKVFEIGGEYLVLAVKGDKTQVISSTAPVSVTIVSDTVVSETTAQ